MALMKLWLTLILLLKFCLAVGQNFITFAGKVVDSVDAKHLPYVGIRVKHQAMGAITNEVGEFVFNLPENAGKDTDDITEVYIAPYNPHGSFPES